MTLSTINNENLQVKIEQREKGEKEKPWIYENKPCFGHHRRCLKQ